MSEIKPSRYHQEHSDATERVGRDDNFIARTTTAGTVSTINIVDPQRPLRSLANPAPLGLAGFAFTTFVFALINLETQGVKVPNVIIGPAFAYGGVAQFCAGMWEMAIGNTFGATALASYGAFWVSYALNMAPELGVASAYSTEELAHANGLFLMGFFIFTVFLTFCTMKTTAPFLVLFCLVDVTFLLLGLANLLTDSNGHPDRHLTQAGGVFGLLAAFTAWYMMYAGMADERNSFILAPHLHLPWGEHGSKAEDIQNELGEGRI